MIGNYDGWVESNKDLILNQFINSVSNEFTDSQLEVIGTMLCKAYEDGYEEGQISGKYGS